MQRNSQIAGPKTYSSRFRNGGKPAEAFKIRKLPVEHIDPKHRLYSDKSVEALHGSPLGEPSVLRMSQRFSAVPPGQSVRSTCRRDCPI